VSPRAMRRSGDHSLGISRGETASGAKDVVQLPRVREKVNERFLANTLRGVISGNEREARRQERVGGVQTGDECKLEASEAIERNEEHVSCSDVRVETKRSRAQSDSDDDDMMRAFLAKPRNKKGRGNAVSCEPAGYAFIPELPQFNSTEDKAKKPKKSKKDKKKKKRKEDKG